MIRIPEAGRFEFRLADGSANPYLLQAAILVAGLDGLKTNRHPGERSDFDMYAEPEKCNGAKKLPQNLLDALRNFESSDGRQGRSWRVVRQLLREAEASGVAGLYASSDRMGARSHDGLLTSGNSGTTAKDDDRCQQGHDA